MQSDEQLGRIWSNGDYAAVAPAYLSIAGQLVERADLEPTDDVCDVGCGTGSVALTAAREAASVTGVDVTPSLLEEARANASLADRSNVSWRAGRARSIPADDDAFDVTLSSLGHMYEDPPKAATTELRRVTRPGGRIGFTSWTPTSLYPFVAGVLTTYLPPEAIPAYTEPPFMWGDSTVVERRLEEHVDSVTYETGTTTVPALSPAHFWQQTRRTSGPIRTLLSEVDDADRPALRAEVLETIEPYFEPDRNAVSLEYLLTTATVSDEPTE